MFCLTKRGGMCIIIAIMAQQKISKNARREGAQELKSRWGGKIVMKSLFENGKLRHYAECEQTGKTARRPRDLM